MTQSSFSDPVPQKSAATELWYSRCSAATASALAIRKNWLQTEFAKGGTGLRSRRDSDDVELTNAHYRHQLSGLFREGGNIPPMETQKNFLRDHGYLEQDFSVLNWVEAGPFAAALARLEAGRKAS
jgi:hypothetical protein